MTEPEIRDDLTPGERTLLDRAAEAAADEVQRMSFDAEAGLARLRQRHQEDVPATPEKMISASAGTPLSSRLADARIALGRLTTVAFRPVLVLTVMLLVLFGIVVWHPGSRPSGHLPDQVSGWSGASASPPAAEGVGRMVAPAYQHGLPTGDVPLGDQPHRSQGHVRAKGTQVLLGCNSEVVFTFKGAFSSLSALVLFPDDSSARKLWLTTWPDRRAGDVRSTRGHGGRHGAVLRGLSGHVHDQTAGSQPAVRPLRRPSRGQ
jgi:hypothetical protein